MSFPVNVTAFQDISSNFTIPYNTWYDLSNQLVTLVKLGFPRLKTQMITTLLTTISTGALVRARLPMYYSDRSLCSSCVYLICDSSWHCSHVGGSGLCEAEAVFSPTIFQRKGLLAYTTQALVYHRRDVYGCLRLLDHSAYRPISDVCKALHELVDHILYSFTFGLLHYRPESIGSAPIPLSHHSRCHRVSHDRADMGLYPGVYGDRWVGAECELSTDFLLFTSADLS